MKQEVDIALPANRCIAILIAVSMIALGGTAVADEEAQTKPAGQTFRDCSDCPEMVMIPAGTFLMGSSAAETTRDLESLPPSETTLAQRFTAREHPQHSVSIGRPFGLGKYLVTRGEFAAFVRETGYSTSGGCTLFANHRYQRRAEAGWQNPGITQTDRDPVVCVNWQDAKAYVAWLNGKLRGGVPREGDGPYRLPSEAEWEYAARAGTQTARWWGDAVGSERANCDGCGSQRDKQQTTPVGSFPLNPFGLSDMLGNVWEWTGDCWNETYAGAPADGRTWDTGKCESRALRGGAFANLPWLLRSATRTTPDPPLLRANFIGFRVVKELRRN